MNNNKKSILSCVLVVISALFAGPAIAQTPIAALSDAMPLEAMPEYSVRIEGTAFKDHLGRTLILRGVNATGNAKLPPFQGITTPEQLDPLPGWGINALRLLFIWEAFEPLPGMYNMDYLNHYQRVIDWAANRGLYVVVDFHQDAFSRFLIDGCGEGFPAWAIHSSIALDTPVNDERCESWGIKMIIDFNHHRAWHHFHRNTQGAKSAYVSMVSTVAEALQHQTNVVGYEIINEPWGTNSELSALYSAVAQAIREHHPGSIVFVPPHALLSSGLLKNSMEKPAFEDFVYSPHFYDPFVIMTKTWLGNASQKPLDEMHQQAQTWQVPLFLGEFGAPAQTHGVAGYTHQIYDWLDSRFASSAHWNYTPDWSPITKDGWNHEDLSIVDDTGALRENFVVRPYPQFTAGTPVEFQLDADQFVFRWHNEPELGETEMFLPESWYDAQVHLDHADGACEIRISPWQQGKLICQFPQPGQVQITVTR